MDRPNDPGVEKVATVREIPSSRPHPAGAESALA
jgi:hypothetical protein